MLVAKSMGAGEMTHGLRVLTALTFFQKRTLRGVGSLSTYTDFRSELRAPDLCNKPFCCCHLPSLFCVIFKTGFHLAQGEPHSVAEGDVELPIFLPPLSWVYCLL